MSGKATDVDGRIGSLEGRIARLERVGAEAVTVCRLLAQFAATRKNLFDPIDSVAALREFGEITNRARDVTKKAQGIESVSEE